MDLIILIVRQTLAAATISITLLTDLPDHLDVGDDLRLEARHAAETAEPDGPREHDGSPVDHRDEPRAGANPVDDSTGVRIGGPVEGRDVEQERSTEAFGTEIREEGGRDLVAVDARPGVARAGEMELAFELEPDTAQQAGSPGFNASNDFKAGAGCSVWCFKKGVAYARGVDVELVVETDTPALITLSVFGASPASYHVSSQFNQLTTAYSVHLDGLQPGTTYQVLATATDGADKTSYATGSFTTLRRQVEVTFHGFEVDEYPYDDRFDFHYRVGNSWPGHLRVTHWPYPSTPPSLPKPVVIDNAPAVLEGLMVQVKSFSTCPNFKLCTVGGAVDLPSTQLLHGTATVGELDHAWATAYRCIGGVDLDNRPADATSWVEHELVVALTTQNGCVSNQPLQFSVGVGIKVTYVQ